MARRMWMFAGSWLAVMAALGGAGRSDTTPADAATDIPAAPERGLAGSVMRTLPLPSRE